MNRWRSFRVGFCFIYFIYPVGDPVGLVSCFCEFLVSRFLAYRQIARARARIETILFLDRNGVQAAVAGNCHLGS
jgi:hypothetical protein